MRHYSESRIKILYQEFIRLKSYIDKLFFFDLHFGIISFHFPAFDPSLSFLFKEDKTSFLIHVLKNERNNPSLHERLFSFGGDYRFNIKPTNSNSSIYSRYILSKFLSSAPDFDGLIKKRKNRTVARNASGKPLLEEANGMINRIEYKLQNEYDKSLKLHCMAVFYKGYADSFSGHVVLPAKKRKFIELFLYAHGILYEKYIHALRIYYAEQPAEIHFISQPSYNLKNKISLLREIGIIDLFKKGYGNMDPREVEKKLAELINLIIRGGSNGRNEVRKQLSASESATGAKIFCPPEQKPKTQN